MYHIMPKITYAGIIRQGLTYIHMSAAIYTHSPTPAHICTKGRHEPAHYKKPWTLQQSRTLKRELLGVAAKRYTTSASTEEQPLS